MLFSLEYGILKMYTNKYELTNERIVGLQQRVKKQTQLAANTDWGRMLLLRRHGLLKGRFAKAVDITAYSQVHDKNFYRERI